MFLLTAAAFVAAGVWYAYLEIDGFLVEKTRRVVYGEPCVIPIQTISTSPRAVFPHPVMRCSDSATPPDLPPAVDDLVDSAAMSGQSGDDLDSKDCDVVLAERCQSGRLFLGVEGVSPLSKKNCAAKYRHLAPLTLGDQLRAPTGIRLRADGKVQLCDSCFIQYRTYNEGNQRREIGCRDRGFSVPFGGVVIRVCQKHMQSGATRRPPTPTAFKQQDLFVQDKNGNFVRMGSDERPLGEMDIGDGVGLSRREKQ